VEVWYTSSLRRLRLGEEKKERKRKIEDRRNRRAKTEWPALFHRAAVVITTTTVLWPFVRDYPGEPEPEETFTHPPS